MAFRDFGWVSERTTVWDGLGLISYAMVFAFFETLGVFLIVILIGFFLPRTWEMDKRLALLGTSFLVVALWTILGQIFSWARYPVPAWAASFMVSTHHILRILWGGVFGLTFISAVIPIFLVVKREKLNAKIVDVFDRISLLSALYVFFDVIGIVIIAIRNFHL